MLMNPSPSPIRKVQAMRPFIDFFVLQDKQIPRITNIIFVLPS